MGAAIRIDKWKIRRTDDPHIRFASDPVALWAYGIVEFKIDTRNGKCRMTPIMRDGSERAVLDASGMFRQLPE